MNKHYKYDSTAAQNIRREKDTVGKLERSNRHNVIWLGAQGGVPGGTFEALPTNKSHSRTIGEVTETNNGAVH